MAKYRLGFLVALLIFALDQLTKWMVLGPLQLREVGQIVLLPIFNLTYVENNGISLGLLNASNEVGRWMLVALTSAIAIGVSARLISRPPKISLCEPQKSSLSSPMRGDLPQSSAARQLNQSRRPSASHA